MPNTITSRHNRRPPTIHSIPVGLSDSSLFLPPLLPLLNLLLRRKRIRRPFPCLMLRRYRFLGSQNRPVRPYTRGKGHR